MPVISRGRVLAAALALLLPAALPAQQDGGDDEQDYKQMLDDALKSGGYAQQSAQGGSSWDARLKVVSGTVMVKTADSEEWSAVTGVMPLDPNDVVKASGDGIAEIYLDDKGAISLGRNTEVEISSLDQQDSVLSISFGSLTAKIKHFLNDKFKFSVRTPAAVCAVRGTEFAVEYSQLGKETGVAVFDEGRVAVTQTGENAKDTQEYILEKNTEISFNPSQRRFRPAPVSRMSRYRAAVITMRSRVLQLKGWRPRPAARRAALRDQALKRKIIRRQINTAPAKTKAARNAKARAAAARRAKARRASRQAREEGTEQE